MGLLLCHSFFPVAEAHRRRAARRAASEQRARRCAQKQDVASRKDEIPWNTWTIWKLKWIQMNSNEFKCHIMMNIVQRCSKHHVQQMQRKRTCNRQQCVNAAQVSCRKSEKKMLVIPWKEQDVESPEEGVEQRSKDVERDSTQRHIAKLWLFTSVCVCIFS